MWQEFGSLLRSSRRQIVSVLVVRKSDVQLMICLEGYGVHFNGNETYDVMT